MDARADAELVSAIALGDRAAEAALCARFSPRVRLYGLKHLRDEEPARDLVQTVLLGVLEAARGGRIAEPAQLDRFVLGTCRNAVARVRQKREPLASDEALQALSVPAQRIELGSLFGCVGALDERGRTVLMLSFVEECSADEIGTRLALSPGNVRVLRHRALQSVRRCLARESP
ncbi:MAG TPA: sigma-70 family RNA polymerase sigma factor [Polyangiales bacterium]|nr:sigma-70 family RNA polymerase sigma factor [Polyangiales bacterium]